LFDYSSHIFKQLNQSDLKEILFIHSHTIETMNNENHPSFGLKHAPDVVLDYVKLKKAARILKSVNLSFPRRVIDLLQEQGPMSSVDIMITLRVDQAYLRTHLNNLIVKKSRIAEKQFGIFYFWQKHTNIHEKYFPIPNHCTVLRCLL